MKQFITLLVSLLLVSSTSSAQHYMLEPNHSTLGFSIPISGGLTKVTGKFTEFDIDLNYDGTLDGDLSTAKFTVSITSNSILTGIQKRDDHLKSEVFLNSETYPEITFISKSVSPDEGENAYTLNGIINIKGVEKEFSGHLTRTGVDKNKNLIGFHLTGTLNKKDFGVGTNIGNKAFEALIGDLVSLDIYFWVVKKPKNN